MGNAYDYSIILNNKLVQKEKIREAIREILEKHYGKK